MTEKTENTEAAEDVWGQLNMDEQTAGSSDRDSEEPLDFQIIDDAVDDAVESKTTPVEKKKKNPILIVIGLVVATAVGGFGYTGYSFYRKMVPSKVSENIEPSVLLGLPNQAALSKNNGVILPDTVSKDLNVAAAEPTPVQMTPQSPAPVVVTASVPVTSPVTPPAAVQEVARVVIAPLAVTPAPVVIAITKSPEIKVKPPVEVAPKKEKPPVVVKVTAVNTQPKKIVVTHSGVKKPSSNIAKKKLEKEEFIISGKKSVENEPSKLLMSFKIMAFEPRFGQFQQAWIKSESGEITIIRSGDSFQGIQVTKISDGIVKTSQGDLR